MQGLICFDKNQSKMKSKSTKEEQIILGKSVVEILKTTITKEAKLVEHIDVDSVKNHMTFFMANVPLISLDCMQSFLDQYPDDFLFFKDEKEAPVALCVPKEKLAQHKELFTSSFESFSNWLEALGETYRVQCLKGIRSIFSKSDVEWVTRSLQCAINKKWMEEGVTLVDSKTIYIEFDAEIGLDTIIYPNSFIKRRSIIGEECVIGPGARIDQSILKNHVHVLDSTILESTVGEFTKVGPYAYIRPNSKVGDHVKVGDFVEIKNANIGNGTKISHLSYVGDADLGEHVNVGCGVVFVNYNGKDKQRSLIKDHVFIGCNANVVAPVVLESLAYVAAGTTVTKDVPAGALALGRARQENKEGWVKKKQLIQKK